MRARYPDDEGFVERDGVRVFYERFGAEHRNEHCKFQDETQPIGDKPVVGELCGGSSAYLPSGMDHKDIVNRIDVENSANDDH